LKKVERARVDRDKEEKKRKRNEKLGISEDVSSSNPTQISNSNSNESGSGSGKVEKRNFTFKQRAPVLRDVRDQEGSSWEGKKRKREGNGGKVRDMRSGMGEGGKQELKGVLSKIF